MISKTNIGILLLALYILQCLIPLEFEALENLQRNLVYKKWTGFALLILILSQWLLPIYKGVYGSTGSNLEKKLDFHKTLGIILPIAFFIHSTQPGYGFLLFLTIIFFLNQIIGVLNFKKLYPYLAKYTHIWLSVHILFSTLILIITFLHIWIVFFYN